MIDASPWGSGSGVTGSGGGGWSGGGGSGSTATCRQGVKSHWISLGVIECEPSQLGEEGVHLAQGCTPDRNERLHC